MVRSFQASSWTSQCVCVYIRACLTSLPTVWALVGVGQDPQVRVVSDLQPQQLPSPGHPYLSQVKLSTRASGADDQVLRKQEALPLSLLLQGKGPQAPPGDLALLGHGHLDEGPCGWRRDPESISQDNLCL